MQAYNVPLKQQNTLTRRAFFALFMQMGVGTALVLKMRHLQIQETKGFALLADENRINLRVLPPARGDIYDRNGAVLAYNVYDYRITLIRAEANDIEETLSQLSYLIKLPPSKIKKLTTDIKRNNKFTPMTIADQLSWDELALVSLNMHSLPGVFPEASLTRYYPFDRDFAHIVGYVGLVSDYDLSKIQNPDPVLRTPRFQIGKTGIESTFDNQLRGVAGVAKVEVNAMGRVMRELDRKDSQVGRNIQITIDKDLQHYLTTRIAKTLASAAVVIELETGDILAMNSYPTFDPNQFGRGISVKNYEKMLENPYKPLFNRALQGLYPPGSVFKPVVAIAALEHNVINPDHYIDCPGYVDLGNRRFHCWKHNGHGAVNLYKALSQSCDVYFYHLSTILGIDKIVSMAQRFGIGETPDIAMQSISKGLLPNPNWKQSVKGERWTLGDTLNAAIGQGFILVSPLQMAIITARLATNKKVYPKMIKTTGQTLFNQTPAAFLPLGLSDDTLRIIQNALFGVVNDKQGTAYKARIVQKNPNVYMAGKTGTSQVRTITQAERKSGVIDNKNLAWQKRDHALFVGYAPAHAPRYAVATVIEHGGESLDAAVMARDIMVEVLKGKPPFSAYFSSIKHAR